MNKWLSVARKKCTLDSIGESFIWGVGEAFMIFDQLLSTQVIFLSDTSDVEGNSQIEDRLKGKEMEDNCEGSGGRLLWEGGSTRLRWS